MLPAKRIYDISMPLSDMTPVWPLSKPFKIKWLKNIEKDGVNESELSFNTHTGTHIDLPFHFIKAGKTVRDLSLERLLGKAMVVEFAGKNNIDVEFLKTIDIPKDSNKLLFKTLNSQFDVHQSEFRENFIALNLDSTEWIIEKGIDLVGIDYLSIEEYSNTDNRIHELLLGKDIIILEGLILKHVPEGCYNLFALPLSIPEAEGAPVRAVLIKEKIL